MEISFSFHNLDVPTTSREKKGKSIIAVPDNYCVIDIETTGLSPEWDYIIEIGAIKYSSGHEIARFQSLVQPPKRHDGLFIDQFIEEMTGITNDMLVDAPDIVHAITAFSDFISDSVVIGYNVNFDINFLYDAYTMHLHCPFSNNYIDLMRFARKLYPDLPHHRLQDMILHFGLKNKLDHRSISDCEVTQLCYQRLRNDILLKYDNYDSFVKDFDKKRNTDARLIQSDEALHNPDCPLYHRNCVITGKLDRFSRSEAMQIIADLGGINENGVTKNTNFLILGNNDYCLTIKDGKSNKQKKAEAYKLKGRDIEIIPEAVFYDMISDFISEITNKGL